MTEKIKTLKIIHLAITGSVIMIYLLQGDISQDALSIPEIDSSSALYIAIPIIALILGNFLFRMLLKKVDKNTSLDDNFGAYQTASIIRWAVMEGAAFMILFIAPDFMLLGIFLILYLLFLRPTEDKVKAGLQYLN